jgi:Tfp pilus assembly protein PilW
MECSVTFTKKRSTAAFTLMEYIVGMTLASIIMLGLSQLTFFTGRSFAALFNYTELDRYSRNALDQMVYKIRQADYMSNFASNKMDFSYNGTNTLTYYYNKDQKTLTEMLQGRSKVLLRGCDLLTFSIFQRNTASGTYDQFPATLTNNAVKLVQLNWTCSRTVLGARINSESVQSAKIVIRNP